jgi:hypothetical protein
MFHRHHAASKDRKAIIPAAPRACQDGPTVIVKARAFGEFERRLRPASVRGGEELRNSIRLLPLVALSLAACADRPRVDQIAQTSMIGLSTRDILACFGEPAHRWAVAPATEIWAYPIGVTTTDTPPWGAGLNFAATEPSLPCDVRLVMTNAHVSQVTYALPDGRALPSARRCAFPVQACARRRELL